MEVAQSEKTSKAESSEVARGSGEVKQNSKITILGKLFLHKRIYNL